MRKVRHILCQFVFSLCHYVFSTDIGTCFPNIDKLIIDFTLFNLSVIKETPNILTTLLIIQLA